MNSEASKNLFQQRMQIFFISPQMSSDLQIKIISAAPVESKLIIIVWIWKIISAYKRKDNHHLGKVVYMALQHSLPSTFTFSCFTYHYREERLGSGFGGFKRIWNSKPHLVGIKNSKVNWTHAG